MTGYTEEDANVQDDEEENFEVQMDYNKMKKNLSQASQPQYMISVKPNGKTNSQSIHPFEQEDNMQYLRI